ncbi:MAG TPA: ABC transporter ATP-binding protein [Aestuariivirgaceae bacterium]|nr:ABC transporter ATP-binding protein [Aestuariivirgaceae bacterium]
MTAIETQRDLEDGAPVLEARGIHKHFAGVIANVEVDLSLRRGDIHAILGENGAGKSTIASVLTGLYSPDSGEILVHGRPVQFRHPGDALARRIGMVHQHFHLVESFTVAENVLLGHPEQRFFSGRGDNETVAALGRKFELEIRPEARIADLSTGERQRVEIVKMLYRDVEILFLDEPTAVLTPQEAQSLFRTLRAMSAAGKSIVLITHKLEEVMAVANRATIMRQGRVVETVSVARSSVDALARLMIGQGVAGTRTGSTRTPAMSDQPIMVAEQLGLTGWSHRAGDPIDFAVRAGEILGVAGIAGNGQLQLAETLAGLLPARAGRFRVNGVEIAGRGARVARAAGLAYIPQDRLGTGLARGLSIADNLRLTGDLPFVLSDRGAETAATAAIRDFGIKTRSPWEKTGRLSGGNIQKVLLARELGAGANALIVASPTQGLDLTATEFVRDLLDTHRRKGGSILLISEDLDEICLLADRIVVMYAGCFVLERRAVDADRMELGLAMAGAAAR